VCKEDGCNPLAGVKRKKKVDCPLLLMCDLTSFANGNFNLGSFANGNFNLGEGAVMNTGGRART